MPIALYRIDDRLIHGQVVVGWGQPLELRIILLVDDDVAASEWEQELYRMGVPPEMTVHFLSVADASAQLEAFERDPRPAIVLVGNVETMERLVRATNGTIEHVNVGGVHHQPGRHAKLRYVFLNDADVTALRDIERLGAVVTAQDVPTSRPIPLGELLESSLAS